MTTTSTSAPTTAPGAPAPSTMQRAGDWARRAPLLPALVFMIVVTQIPFVATLVISFMDWNAYYPDDRGFAGLSNFGKVLTDVDARQAIIVTIILTVSVVLLSLVLGLLIALLLDRKFRGRAVARTLMITPFLIVPVAAALVWKHAIYNAQYGLLNGILRWIGGSGAPQPDWISNHPLAAIVVTLVWQWTPFMMLILLAGLQSRPMDVVEAARIDGASPWQIFTNMTLPHLRQYIELSGLLGAIYIIQNFDAVFTITSGGLGTANLPYYIYETFYSAHDYGRASAAGVIVVIGSIIIATFALRTVISLFREDTR
ncbi:Binding-protein-dependent transport systems inner membrane component [Nostocoides japonicum T1-X7]|uniref:Binding-protein-dependent transport systems inner membrane component n=1 Tax=Nostocoides japonicum T1-X7 TaxID=1194083 RepID=A0A077M775_9MICO|nr:sugar ABC transporter permease [Tetrasphaera japonica]CCH80004.1 Binding-protein-dependent transport systems inner membrane component [Tetrasphaera japonica T1-X7]